MCAKSFFNYGPFLADIISSLKQKKLLLFFNKNFSKVLSKYASFRHSDTKNNPKKVFVGHNRYEKVRNDIVINFSNQYRNHPTNTILN